MSALNVQEPTATPATPAGTSPGTPGGKPPRSFSERFARWVLIVVFGSIALFALYTWGSLHYTFSEGERVGYARKLSHRGWLCKTWEGEISMSNIPGAQESVFAFTVRDDAVIEQIRKLEGKQVTVLYKERKGVPSSCFGDTLYHVYGVRQVK